MSAKWIIFCYTKPGCLDHVLEGLARSVGFAVYEMRGLSTRSDVWGLKQQWAPACHFIGSHYIGKTKDTTQHWLVQIGAPHCCTTFFTHFTCAHLFECKPSRSWSNQRTEFPWTVFLSCLPLCKAAMPHASLPSESEEWISMFSTWRFILDVCHRSKRALQNLKVHFAVLCNSLVPCTVFFSLSTT